jgi:hypothetical protein
MPEPMNFPWDESWQARDLITPEIGVNDPSIVVPEAEHPLEIFDNSGELLFRLRGDGTGELPNPERANAAARLFWTEVLAVAELLGISIRTEP